MIPHAPIIYHFKEINRNILSVYAKLCRNKSPRQYQKICTCVHCSYLHLKCEAQNKLNIATEDGNVKITKHIWVSFRKYYVLYSIMSLCHAKRATNFAIKVYRILFMLRYYLSIYPRNAWLQQAVMQNLNQRKMFISSK